MALPMLQNGFLSFQNFRNVEAIKLHELPLFIYMADSNIVF